MGLSDKGPTLTIYLTNTPVRRAASAVLHTAHCPPGLIHRNGSAHHIFFTPLQMQI